MSRTKSSETLNFILELNFKFLPLIRCFKKPLTLFDETADVANYAPIRQFEAHFCKLPRWGSLEKVMTTETENQKMYGKGGVENRKGKLSKTGS